MCAGRGWGDGPATRDQEAGLRTGAYSPLHTGLQAGTRPMCTAAGAWVGGVFYSKETHPSALLEQDEKDLASPKRNDFSPSVNPEGNFLNAGVLSP